MNFAFSTPLPMTKVKTIAIPKTRSSLTPRCSTAVKTATNIKKVSDTQLCNLVESNPKPSLVVIKCFAKYCAGCRGVEPKYRKIAAAYAPHEKVHFCEIDFANHEQFCRQQLGVENLPFFGIWKNGQYIGGESMGWTTVSNKLVNKIENALTDSDRK